MSFDYLTAIKPFAQQVFDPLNQPPEKWKWISCFNVLRSLLRLLDNPDAIAQSCFGLCGQVAFLRSWAYRDPVAVANFLIDLYEDGTAKIGDFEVAPDNEIKHCNWLSDPAAPGVTGDAFNLYWEWGPGNPISESVWMICGGLANITRNSIAVVAGMFVPGQPKEFDGWPASNVWTLALPKNITTWLEKTGCYTSVADNTNVVKNAFKPHITLASDPVITSNFSEADDIILCINTGMLYNAIKITPSLNINPPQFTNFPDHYVMLTGPISQYAGEVTMNIWTWGGYYQVQVSLNNFNDNYYGSIAAHAASPRRKLNLPPHFNGAIRNQRIYFGQDKLLHFNWESIDTTTEWFEIHRIDLKSVDNPVNTGKMTSRDILQRVWPASIPASYQISSDSSCWFDPADTQYEIVACHAALRPYDCDPFCYNHYADVQCNLKVPYQYSGFFNESETNNFLYNYDQVSYKHAPLGDQTITFAGENIGTCHQDGRIEIMENSKAVLVGNQPGTPLAVQAVAVWLEYFRYLFGRPPYSLRCCSGSDGIEVMIGNGPAPAYSSDDLMHKIRIITPVSDQDIPIICLKVLLTLESVETGNWPEWIFPPFVSQATIVQIPTPMVPDGYALFNSLQPCESMTPYDAQWNTTAKRRALKINANDPLNPEMIAVIFVKFDPMTIRDDSIKVALTGQTPDGNTVNIPVVMLPSPDHQYYYGSFQPVNTWSSNYQLRLEIQGTKSWQNNVLEALIGDGIDPNPLTIATMDQLNPATLMLLNVEAGADKNHRIEIGTPSLYAPITSLTPDALEGNDSFSAATAVSLIVPDTPQTTGAVNGDSKTFDQLNFHNQQDNDYFSVSYQCPASDDTDEANSPRSTHSNSHFGITYTHLPPILFCRMASGICRCLDVAIYKCDALNRGLYASESKSIGYSIDSPSRSLGAKSCYFVIKNHDFASQGAFPYSLTIGYSSAYDSVNVNLDAPGYNSYDTRADPTIRRKILERLYSRIDLPRPPDDTVGMIHVDDIASFVEGYEKFLMDPETGVLLSQPFKKNGRAFAAEGLHFLGQLAQTFKRYDDSERIYQESANMFSDLGEKDRAVGAMESLAGLYKKLEKSAAFNRVEKQIRNIQRTTH